MTKATPKAVKKTKKPPRIPRKDPIRELAQTVAKAAYETKAADPHILDVRGIASFADYLIICGGTNARQVIAIADRIDEKISKEYKKKPMGIEGKETGNWVLMDYGDVVCHIFLEELRQLYRLEDLWHNAKRVKLK